MAEVAGFVQKKGAQELAENQQVDGVLCGDQDFIACSLRRIHFKASSCKHVSSHGVLNSAKSRRRVCATH